jgi:Zn-dependent protease with chaperone function
MYFLLVISLIFALLLAINILSAIAAEIVWRVAAPRVKNLSARRQSQFIFALSIFPFAGALVFVFVFLLPAYLLYEPHSSGEIVTYKLALISFVSLIGVFIAFYRVFGTWWTTRRLVSNWMKRAERVEIENVSIPAFRISHQFPVIAVVGTFRPRMFVAEQIFASLTDDELQAAIAHEFGHLRTRDNLKRTMLRVCRDLLVVPFGKTLERAWTESAESAADEHAAQMGEKTAINLASALVKIARIVPHGAKPAMPSGAFLIAEQAEYISFRVRRLLEFSGINLQNTGNQQLTTKILFRFSLVAFVSIILLLATNSSFLQNVHDLTESIVAALQ